MTARLHLISSGCIDRLRSSMHKQCQKIAHCLVLFTTSETWCSRRTGPRLCIRHGCQHRAIPHTFTLRTSSPWSNHDANLSGNTPLPTWVRRTGSSACPSIGQLQPQRSLEYSKGLPNVGEDLERAARRETLEETGVVAGDLVALGSIDYTKTRKRVYCFAGPLPADAAPMCASWEVDRAELVNVAEARKLIHPDQGVFIDRLKEQLKPD